MRLISEKKKLIGKDLMNFLKYIVILYKESGDGDF